MVVSAKAHGVPVAAFCVEQGRWAARGGEVLSKLCTSTNSLAFKSMKIANLIDSQNQIWSGVSRAQDKLKRSLGASVSVLGSPTSLELSLSSVVLKKEVQRYLAAVTRRLGQCAAKHAVGLGVAINGEMSMVHLYASRALFARLWPKLLKEAAVEAVAERKQGLRFRAPQTDAVWRFISMARRGQQTTLNPSPRVRICLSENDNAVATQTYDVAARDMLHESFLAR
jgi:hypothetical protein